MSTRQEVGIINVKYHRHKATRTLNVTSEVQLGWRNCRIQYRSLCSTWLFHDFDAWKLLEASSSMHYRVETNALICLIKRLAEAYSGVFSLHQLLPETPLLCYWNLRFWTSTFLWQQCIYYKYLYRNSCNITSSANKSRIYLHIIVSSCGLEFQFLSAPTHSRLPCLSTRSTFYVPNPPRL